MPGSRFTIARRHGRVITLLALLALFLGQSMAVAHAARHLGKDAPALPGTHVQLCTDCASLAPLLSVAGGSAPPVFAPAECAAVMVSAVQGVCPAQPPHYAFRSRAPPR
jgi:hypothetical protein